jgi:hypothetical protein
LERALQGERTPNQGMVPAPATPTSDDFFDDSYDSPDEDVEMDAAEVPDTDEPPEPGARSKFPNKPLAEDVLPDDPEWEVFEGGRVIRRYKGTSRPRGVWPEVWALTSHVNRKKYIKKANDIAAAQHAAELIADQGADRMAAAAVREFQHVERRIVEFCTGSISKLGDSRYSSDGCNIIRLTMADDVTKPMGHAKAMAAVRAPNCLLWASMPCVGGSPW